MPRVAVIILMWNSRRFLENLLFSLKRMALPEGGASFIFVDNASTDGSADYVRMNFHEAIVVENKQNLGFAGGNNVGLRTEAARTAEYVALLNPDTEVSEYWLIELEKALDQDPSAASAQSLLLYGQDRGKINSAGNEIHFLGFGFSKDNGKPLSVVLHKAQRSEESPACDAEASAKRADAASHPREILSPFTRAQDDTALKEIAYASGAAALYRRKYLEEMGLFDETLFMYHDDLDVGWKFMLRGFKSVLAPASVVYHHYEFFRSIQKYYWMERNRLLILLTHYHARTLILLLPALLLLEAGLTLFSLVRGFFRSRIQAYGWIVTHLPFIMRKRRFVQELRARPDSALLSHFTGVISDQEISNPIVDYCMNPIMSAYLFILRKIIHW